MTDEEKSFRDRLASKLVAVVESATAAADADAGIDGKCILDILLLTYVVASANSGMSGAQICMATEGCIVDVFDQSNSRKGVH